jgi:PAS domain S-box-containing protein
MPGRRSGSPARPARRQADAARPAVAKAPAIPPTSAFAVDFAAIVESLPMVVYTLDLEGRFTYLNGYACDLMGYDRAERSAFVGRSFMDVLGAGTMASAVDAIRHRVEQPYDRQTFRIDVKRKDGTPLAMEAHSGPVWSDGRMIGRVGVCRPLDGGVDGENGASHRSSADGMQDERMRIARGLRDAIAQVVFGVTPDHDASEGFLVDVKRATRGDLARRLSLDDVDLDILQHVARGASNQEIGHEVHLSAAAVKDRIRRLMTRLGARRRAELAAHALRLGLA